MDTFDERSISRAGSLMRVYPAMTILGVFSIMAIAFGFQSLDSNPNSRASEASKERRLGTSQDD
jgi:hypothetical protein